MLRFIHAVPVPVIAAITSVDMPANAQGPQWFLGAVTAAFVILWLLNAIGKLPGSQRPDQIRLNPDDRKLLTEAATHTHEMYRIVSREDPDRPGWPMVWRATKEMKEAHAALISLSELKDVWLEDRERANAERAQVAEERRRLERRIEHLEKLVNGRDV